MSLGRSRRSPLAARAITGDLGVPPYFMMITLSSKNPDRTEGRMKGQVDISDPNLSLLEGSVVAEALLGESRLVFKEKPRYR